MRWVARTWGIAAAAVLLTACGAIPPPTGSDPVFAEGWRDGCGFARYFRGLDGGHWSTDVTRMKTSTPYRDGWKAGSARCGG
mgnify:CR=1 FL=1